ncbi:hypothetical protein Tco_1164964 [Tanacetum coccineum]
MAKPISNNAQERNPSESRNESNVKIEFFKELLIELQNNTFSGRSEEDVIEHTGKVLKILDLVKIAGVDPFQLRMKAFPLSLSKGAKEWWINEGNRDISTWEEDAYNSSGTDLSGAHQFENINNEQPNKGICRVDKFEVIKYMIGDNEEFLAICTRECDSWARTVNRVSSIYHDIFRKKDEGWTVHRTK